MNRMAQGDGNGAARLDRREGSVRKRGNLLVFYQLEVIEYIDKLMVLIRDFQFLLFQVKHYKIVHNNLLNLLSMHLYFFY